LSNADQAAVFARNLDRIRTEIDAVDLELIALMARRNALTRSALALKQLNKVPLHCPEREREILDHVRSLAVEYGIQEDMVQRVFMLLLRQYVGNGDGT
jgi:chorismate mutase